MKTFTDFVAQHAELRARAGALPLAEAPRLQHPAPRPDAPCVLIMSPHPDDECIIGGLALRLMRQSGWRVINVAITQGSNRQRQAARYDELKAACDYIGFDLVQTLPNGLEKVTVQTRAGDAAHWANSVEILSRIIRAHAPAAILYPHELDWNGTHIGTHWLIRDAMRAQGPDFRCWSVETEFWGQMATPNLMVEISVPDLGDLVTALTFHVGEVRRNPYHLTLPAWMEDNVRRGGELVGGQGGAAPSYQFATLYRLGHWSGGQLHNVLKAGRTLAATDDPASLFSSL